jgi:hypothetical protein
VAASLDYLDYAKFYFSSKAAHSSYPIREHPLMALRVPVRVHWASVESGLAGKGVRGETEEVYARYYRGYIDVLLRQSDHSDPKADPKPELQRMLQTIQGLVQKRPNNPLALDLLAVTHFALGQRDEALKAIDRARDAVKRMPDSPKRRRAALLLSRHEAEFRAGLPDKVPRYELAAPKKKEPDSPKK